MNSSTITQKKKYPAKVSYFMIVLISALYIGPFVINFESIDLNAADNSHFFILGFFLLSYAALLSLFFGTSYAIINGEFKVSLAFFLYKSIPIEQIKCVQKTKSWMSAPAPSFDRIEIQFNETEHLVISPKDKMSLIYDLQSVNQDIEIKLEGLK